MCPHAGMASDVTVWTMTNPSDLTDDQWPLRKPVFDAPGKAKARDRVPAAFPDRGQGCEKSTLLHPWPDYGIAPAGGRRAAAVVTQKR